MTRLKPSKSKSKPNRKLIIYVGLGDHNLPLSCFYYKTIGMLQDLKVNKMIIDYQRKISNKYI